MSILRQIVQRRSVQGVVGRACLAAIALIALAAFGAAARRPHARALKPPSSAPALRPEAQASRHHQARRPSCGPRLVVTIADLAAPAPCPPDLDRFTQEDRDIAERLRIGAVAIDAVDRPLLDVLDRLAATAGINIIVDRRHVPKPGGIRVTLATTDCVQNVLDRLLAPAGLTHVVEGGWVVVSTREAIEGRISLELYDVSALVYRENIAPTGASDAVPDAPSGRFDAITGDDLIDFVLHRTDDDWLEEKGKSIQAQNGLLVVRTTRAVHARVAALVGELHATTNLRRRLADAQYMLGDQWMGRDDYARASASYGKALRLWPEHALADLMLAEAEKWMRPAFPPAP